MTTLLLHPIGLDAAGWRRCPIPDAVALDLPGHGAAPMTSAGSLDDVADAVVAQTDAGPLDVVGVSLGGMVALHLALTHPDRIRSLVVACAPAATPAEIMRQRAVDTRGAGMAGMLDTTLVRWFSPPVLADPAGPVPEVRERLLGDDPEVVARYWEFIADHDVTAALGEITAPVTVIAGATDLSTPPAMARVVADGVPGARYVELDGPHMLHLEHPDAFAAAVAVHLDRVAH